jgi:hypothetical protein
MILSPTEIHNIEVGKLNELIEAVKALKSDDTKYGTINLSSLEELTEPRKFVIMDDSGDIKPIEHIEPCPECGHISLEVSCDGDMLGQCEPGCDGVSKRGSCIDDEHCWTDEVRKARGLHPVDYVHSSTIENSTASDVSDDSIGNYSNKPRTSPGYLDGYDVTSDRDSGLGSLSEAVISERRANMSCDVAIGEDDDLWLTRADLLELLGIEDSEPVSSVVYCCNGAKYEDKQ